MEILETCQKHLRVKCGPVYRAAAGRIPGVRGRQLCLGPDLLPSSSFWYSGTVLRLLRPQLSRDISLYRYRKLPKKLASLLLINPSCNQDRDVFRKYSLFTSKS